MCLFIEEVEVAKVLVGKFTERGIGCTEMKVFARTGRGYFRTEGINPLLEERLAEEAREEVAAPSIWNK